MVMENFSDFVFMRASAPIPSENRRKTVRKSKPRKEDCLYITAVVGLERATLTGFEPVKLRFFVSYR